MKRFFVCLGFLSLVSTSYANEGQTPVGQDDSFKSFDERQIESLKGEGETRLRVVQTYAVNREKKVELGLRYGNQYAGDAYSLSQGIGLNVGYNINRFWAVAVDYNQYVSKLTQEGKNLVNNDLPNRLPAGREFVIDVDSIKSSMHGMVVFYPMNGKLNLLERRTLYFDPYISAGYGVVNTQRINSNSLQVTGGLSFWINPSLTLKLENRFMTYDSSSITGKTRINANQFGLAVGVLL